jgi:uncharacterized LabA/DUF88 family protein
MTKTQGHLNAYIDGFNLYFGALHDRPRFKWLDVKKLVTNLAKSHEVSDVYYFTAQIRARNGDDSAPNRQNYYLRALRESGVKVVLGTFRKDPKYLDFASRDPAKLSKPGLDMVTQHASEIVTNLFTLAQPESPKALVSKFEEKGSDVNLASYLLRDAYLGKIDRALVLTGDTDMITPLSFAQEHGVFIHSVIPRHTHAARAFEQVANYVEFVDEDLLERGQFDPGLKFANGKHALRPRSWC